MPTEFYVEVVHQCAIFAQNGLNELRSGILVSFPGSCCLSEFSNICYNRLQPVTTDPITLGRSDQFQPKSGGKLSPEEG